MECKLSIDIIDLMNENDFIGNFGNVIEHGHGYTKQIYLQRPFKTVDNLFNAFSAVLNEATLEEKIKILQNHPQLGSKNKMTKLSTLEQERAGIRNISQEEAEEMEKLNKRYLQKFGFNFVVCVRNKDPGTILKILRERINNDMITETKAGIEEVKQIVNARLSSMIIK